MENNVKVKELLKDIETNLAQRSASRKDEVRVMQAMLNDKTYKVGEYSAEGKVGEYCPREDAVKMVTSILSNGAKISNQEAAKIAEDYEFTKNDATAMVGISKEFVDTYVRCGRKLPIGGRADMSVSLSMKKVPAQEKKLPMNKLNASDTTVVIPAHASIKAQGGCPKWVRGK